MITELPLVVVDVQKEVRLPEFQPKLSRQTLIRLFTAGTESVPLQSSQPTPSHCFDSAFYAGKFAMEHMMPVILLTEGFLGNGSEPWKVPAMKDYPK